jgi:hypothetical protein
VADDRKHPSEPKGQPAPDTSRSAPAPAASHEPTGHAETDALCAVPGLVESVREAMDEPIDACTEELDW